MESGGELWALESVFVALDGGLGLRHWIVSRRRTEIRKGSGTI